MGSRPRHIVYALCLFHPAFQADARPKPEFCVNTCDARRDRFSDVDPHVAHDFTEKGVKHEVGKTKTSGLTGAVLVAAVVRWANSRSLANSDVRIELSRQIRARRKTRSTQGVGLP